MDAVRYKNTEMQMPPEGKLSDEQIADLERWIRLGAPDPRHQPTRIARKTIDFDKDATSGRSKPITDPALPRSRPPTWPRNDVDRFVLSRLEAAKVPPAADAGRAALLRRVTVRPDGTPPTPEELAAFESDTSPDAFAKVVERLLDSPQYGERWGRYWLDVVRYSDTAGDNSDFPIPRCTGIATGSSAPSTAICRSTSSSASNWRAIFSPAEPTRNAPSADHRHRLHRQRPAVRLARRRLPAAPDDRGHARQPRPGVPGPRRSTAPAATITSSTRSRPTTTTASTASFQSTRYPWPGIELEQRQRDLVPLCSAEEVEAVKAPAAPKRSGSAPR